MRGILQSLIKRSTDSLAALLAGLLVACIAASYLTRDQGLNRAGARQPAGRAQAPLVDYHLWQTARRLASQADSAEEQDFAREALRLADHELDQAFATELREAALSVPAGGPLKELADRVTRLKSRVAAGQARIAQLTKEAASKDSAIDQLELAKAQLALDQDELEDAQQDLARQGGDRHSKLERALQKHEAAQQQPAALPKVSASARPATLRQQLALWISLRGRERQLLAAQQQAAAKASALLREHDALDKLVNNRTAPASAEGPASSDNQEGEDMQAMLARLHRLSDQRKSLSELDKRIQDAQQLGENYRSWIDAVEARRRGVLHLLLNSVAAVLAVLIASLLLSRGIRHAFGRQTDRRRLRQLRVIASIAVQLAAAGVILLIIFGTPSQTSTIIGLATAGLTVVLKDFIVAFFGWFALMGRNGIHVGDWVEIEGVSGEVIEVGLLRTVLLEMGNWASTGHPTGRRVAFANSFAIEGHYFNFSTAGQWLWEELQLPLPAAGDPHEIARKIQETIERETAADARLAEQDWERVTHQYDLRPFSASPAVELRPSASGVSIVVRYITRAPQRYEMKTRLYHEILDVLHQPASSPASPVKT